jgi:hypothetical protein
MYAQQKQFHRPLGRLVDIEMQESQGDNAFPDVVE